jgi:dihydrofolate reductase
MKKVILNLAISLDGMIVDENRKFDWIVGDGDTSHDTENQLDFFDFVKSCEVVIMGKVSYDDIPIDTIEGYQNKKFIVLTHSKSKPKEDNVDFFDGDLSKLVRELKESISGNIWIFGGASVCNVLIKKDVIDEYIIGIIPIILGKGKRLFNDDNPKLKLHLEEYSVNQGITILTYSRLK